jgi:hypothetical protein
VARSSLARTDGYPKAAAGGSAPSDRAWLDEPVEPTGKDGLLEESPFSSQLLVRAEVECYAIVIECFKGALLVLCWMLPLWLSKNQKRF